MRYPWANILLFILLLSQLITGFLGFINGQESRSWLLWLHGIGAYAISLILLLKGAIILDVYSRRRGLTGQRIAFAGMMALLLLILITGFSWTVYGPSYLLGFSLITMHVFLAVALIIFIVWHSWHFRWIIRVPRAIGRRTFIRLAGLGIVGLIAWRLASQARHVLELTGSRRRFTGSYETGSFSGVFPQVSWIADNPPPIDINSWRLVVIGSVERPLELTYGQLIEKVALEKKVILDCTGGWYSEQSWRGIDVLDILRLAGVQPSARSVTFVSVSGYRRRFGLDDAANFILATDVAGRPLTHGHGFPLRLVAPGFRGVNWVKWVEQLQVNETSKFWQLPLPLS